MSRSKRRKQDDEEVGGDVREALSLLGWVAPQGEAEVARAEEELAEHPVRVPEELRDAAAVFGREDDGGEVILGPLPSSASAYLDATLARAAREGGEITAEIEERMRRDREAAEREADDGEANESE